jgi:hypothetical protein
MEQITDLPGDDAFKLGVSSTCTRLTSGHYSTCAFRRNIQNGLQCTVSPPKVQKSTCQVDGGAQAGTNSVFDLKALPNSLHIITIAMVTVTALDGIPKNDVNDLQHPNGEWKVVSTRLDNTRNASARTDLHSVVRCEGRPSKLLL